MRKKIFYLVLLLIILIGFVSSSAQISINKEEYRKKSTIIASAYGDFIEPITEKDIYLYRNWNRIPFDPKIIEVNGVYFISGKLSSYETGNYSLQLKEVEYENNSAVVKGDISDSFRINENTSDFNIEPGILKTREPFSFSLENFRDKKINIDVNIKDSSKEISDSYRNSHQRSFEIPALESREILFNKTKETNFLKISFKSENTSYVSPVYIITEDSSEDSETKDEDTSPDSSEEDSESGETDSKELFHSISFNENEININKMVASNNSIEEIEITNKGNFSEKINLSVSPQLRDFISINKESILLSKGETGNIQLNVSSSSREKSIKGKLRATSENITTFSNIYIEFFEEEEDLEKEEKRDNPPASQNCSSELGGEICSEDEKCSGKTVESKDGICCLDECVKKQGNNSGKIIGWIIILLIAGFIFWFYNKYKKTKRDVNVFQFAKGLFSSSDKKQKSPK